MAATATDAYLQRIDERLRELTATLGSWLDHAKEIDDLLDERLKVAPPR
jgi:hypothetical protein